MLEIILVVYLAKKIGKIAEDRGHKRAPNILFFVIMWFACEIIGAAIGVFIFKGSLFPTYVMALVGAAMGAVLSFNIVQKLEDRSDKDNITIEID